MQQDTRIGIALGILLIGIVGALFFRNERTASTDVPEMVDPDSLDERIAERPIAPYLSDQAGGRGDRSWEMPGFLRRSQPTDELDSLGPPDPIPDRASSENAPVTTALGPGRESDHPTREPANPESNGDEPNPFDPPEAETEETEFAEYKVQHGDTLSDLAERFLGSSSRYMELYELNRDRLATPHAIRTGRVIRVPRRIQ